MEYYWELVQFDDSVTLIPPEAVETVKRRWDNKDPIHTNTGSIPANQIKAFRITEKKYSTQNLIEAASQAFDEPVIENDTVMCKWVKKTVPNNQYNKHYGASPGYKRLGDMNGMTIIAWRQPIHQFDSAKMDYCDDSEVQRLTA